MKYAKMIGLAAVAAMALMGFAGAGTASATSLCKDKACTEKYPAGTVVEATLKGSAVLEETPPPDGNGATLDTCTSSTVSGKTTAESGTPLIGDIETLDWGTLTTPCTAPTVTQPGSPEKTFGQLKVEATSEGNGTVSGSGSKVTVGIFGVSCIYGTGTGTTLGTATGGNPATIDINAVIHKQEGGLLCPETTRWTATYTVTKPTPLFFG